MRLILTAVLLLGLGLGLGACSAGRESPAADPTRQPTSSPSAPDFDAPAQPDASDTRACVEVRAGIGAFNARDYEGTVDRFRLAVPLAKGLRRINVGRYGVSAGLMV